MGSARQQEEKGGVHDVNLKTVLDEEKITAFFFLFFLFKGTDQLLIMGSLYQNAPPVSTYQRPGLFGGNLGESLI